MKEILNYELWGNTVSEYLMALLILIVSVIIIQLIKKHIFKKIESTGTEGVLGTKFIIKITSRFAIPLFYLAALYLAFDFIQIPESATKVIKVIYLLIIVWIIIKFARAVIEFMINKYAEESGKEDTVRKFRPLLAFLNFTFYIIGILFILDNLGFHISTVIAGLGIGGIAIALAAQAILGDLFSYFVIYFDRPFELGDFIRVDDKAGVIERIGVKSTKIRSLSGELLVMSNSNLTNSRVHNFKQMFRRRIVFTIGVTYQTKPEQLEEIPKIIKQIIDEAENATFDRSHFFRYGDFSLDFETVFFVETNDYIKYMDIQQEINLKIYKELEKRGIEFAYPTRTLYMKSESKS
ncbi:MAG: mechanosensitive ion channel family protein [Melioribacteraceae bacterium]|nr:mechanosensitive ion channel family protein [Melioribacteraceae bacterium]WKZ69358.1 MAG: mechanosensitive ion channel family protein [Melioribacteraceae bacterium]